MNEPAKKDFRTCVLSSGLVTPAQLDEVIVELWNSRRGDGGTKVQISEQELADKLVELGRLTKYQSGELLAGHTILSLGQYRILDSIGHGGMGEVYKAQHMIMDRIVAIKVLPRQKTRPESIASFMHEIRTQARLQHENLVQAFDAGHDGNVYFLVTEYVPGSDLRKYIRQRGMLSMHEAATIISQAAKGLAHAHSQGLIHRDVKPGNLLVTPEGKTKLSDLGLAGWLNDAESDPRAGKVVGTADYLSPEQIISPGQITPASDIYALGCTLYYAVTGKVPFPGGTTSEKAKRHLEDMPLHPRRLNPNISDEFVDVIADMMHKDPTQRIQSADEVVVRLAPWAEDRVSAPLIEGLEDRLPPVAELSPLYEPDKSEEFAARPSSLFGGEDASGSHSQISQVTLPIDLAHETLPLENTELWLPPKPKWTRETFIIGGAALIAILTLLWVIIGALTK